MPLLRHPDIEGTFDAHDRTVAHYRKAGWVPVAEAKPKRSRRTRRPKSPQPVPAEVQDVPVAGSSDHDKE